MPTFTARYLRLIAGGSITLNEMLLRDAESQQTLVNDNKNGRPD